MIGPYSDELGNVLPQAVPGLGVPIDPLAFAGLLGMGLEPFLLIKLNLVTVLKVVKLFHEIFDEAL